MRVRYRKIENLTVPQLFRKAALEYGNKTVFAYRDKNGDMSEITYQQYYQEIEEFSAGLNCMNFARKRIMIISDNCVRLSQTILASMCLGGIDVEKENTFPAQELKKIAEIIQPEIFCLQNKTSYEKFLSLEIRRPVFLVFYNTENINIPENATDFQSVCDTGKKALASGAFSLAEKISLTKAEQPVTIVFTSGTTGTRDTVKCCG